MAYFFFHHPVESSLGIPGRYAFQVQGSLAGTSFCDAEVKLTISVDALAQQKPGPNVDPCPFADPHPLVHSFCGITRRAGRYFVFGTDQFLSEIVQSGDTIFYGHLKTKQGLPQGLYIDTVLVVDRTIELPTKACPTSVQRPVRVFDIGEAFAQAALDNATADTALLQASDLWNFNLSDADAARGHHQTGMKIHRMIVGATAATTEAVARLRNRTTSYLPLVEHPAKGRALPPLLSRDRIPQAWPSLVELVSCCPRLCGSMKPPVKMSATLGEQLYDAVRRYSGFGGMHAGCVALPPVKWIRNDLGP